MNQQPVLSLKNVHKHFPLKTRTPDGHKAWVKALEPMDLDLHEGRTVGVVGESGCGKTTLGKVVSRLYQADGSIALTDRQGRVQDCSRNAMDPAKERMYRRDVQMVFQDPFSSLNPRMTVGQIIREPIEGNRICANRREADALIAETLEKVGIRADAMARYPHEFSGGQRQRIAIARAIVIKPRLVICDEPTSALDISVQSQVVNLLRDIQLSFGMAYLFISHNLDLVYHLSDRILVMYLGNVMEDGTADQVFNSPRHPYTRALMDSVPKWEPGEQNMFNLRLPGEPPSPVNVPSGCPFRTRCLMAKEQCASQKPLLREVSGGDLPHRVACHFA